MGRQNRRQPILIENIETKIAQLFKNAESFESATNDNKQIIADFITECDYLINE